MIFIRSKIALERERMVDVSYVSMHHVTHHICKGFCIGYFNYILRFI